MTTITLDRENLRQGKYTRAYKDLTSDQLEGLLWLLGEWAIRHGGNHPRAEAAQKALLEFSNTPLGIEEVKSLIRKANR